MCTEGRLLNIPCARRSIPTPITWPATPSLGVRFYSASQVVLGVVYNPFTKELYQAAKGCGAFLNGERLEVSSTTVMEEAMVVSENVAKRRGG